MKYKAEIRLSTSEISLMLVLIQNFENKENVLRSKWETGVHSGDF